MQNCLFYGFLSLKRVNELIEGMVNHVILDAISFHSLFGIKVTALVDSVVDPFKQFDRVS